MMYSKRYTNALWRDPDMEFIDVEYSSSLCSDDECRQEGRGCVLCEPETSFSETLCELVKNSWFSDLVSLPAKYGTEDWDNYGACPLSVRSFEIAAAFFEEFSERCPSPYVLVDPNGYVCFKWIRSRHDRLELTFPSSGGLLLLSVIRGKRSISTVSASAQIVDRAKLLLGQSEGF